MQIRIIFILSVLISAKLAAQDALPVNHEFWIQKDQLIQYGKVPVFTALKPIPDLLYFQKIYSDSLLSTSLVNHHSSWVYRKLFLVDLFKLNSDDLVLRINPLMSFDAGRVNNENELAYRNTRGIRIDGSAGASLTFTSSFYENQAVFPGYISQKITATQVIPGQGLPKILHGNVYDFAWAEGNLSFISSKNLLLEIGYGKRSFGEGYRSLLLSDYSFVYPYIAYRWNYNRFFISAEVHSYVQSLDLKLFDSERFPAKTASLHFIGFRWDNLQISMIESNMYGNSDSLNRFRWKTEFINPVPFLNSIANRGNNMFGFNFKLYLFKPIQLYGQLLVDELDWKHLSEWSSNRNKSGFQLGAKYFDVFAIPGLYWQAEYNLVRPYAYSAGDPSMSYSHYNEPLAHPLGANFREFLTILNYRKSRFMFDAHLAYAITGLDMNNSNWGSNISLSNNTAQLGYPSNGNYVAQGLRTDMFNSNIRISYIINPASYLNISIAYQHHSQSPGINKLNTDFIYISLRTSLDNLYYDF